MARDAGGEFEVGSWRYENRFRYLLGTTLPIAEGRNSLDVCFGDLVAALLSLGLQTGGLRFRGCGRSLIRA